MRHEIQAEKILALTRLLNENGGFVGLMDRVTEIRRTFLWYATLVFFGVQ